MKIVYLKIVYLTTTNCPNQKLSDTEIINNELSD